MSSSPSSEGTGQLASVVVPPDLKGRFCRKPFENLAIDADANAWLCCEDWLSMPVGNVREDGLLGSWNSAAAQAVRASILDGSYRYCNADACPAIVADSLEHMSEVDDEDMRRYIDESTVEMPQGPRLLGLGYDNTCNLKCPTCRPVLMTLSGDARREADRVQREVIDVLPAARVLLITGTGDAFASPLYRTLLRTFDAARWPSLQIILMTNGLLLTPAMWDSIAASHHAIQGVSISVDAATAETYAETRGGDFRRLLENLGFVAALTAAGHLQWLELSFVVQQRNYREMPAFVRMGRRMGCTSVLFQRVMHWKDAMDDAAYAMAAVHRPEHPEHAAFLDVLADDTLSDAIVDLSNLAHLRAALV